jgi:phosphoglycolate phosphatase-like HAD superfamily hydrolase
LGVERDRITFGHVIADECARLGISIDDYVDHYDNDAAQPFAGVDALLDRLGRWAVCSNKHPRSGWAELARLRWAPEVALFTDSFNGPKRLAPVLDAVDLTGDQVVFIGDTAHDRAAAAEVGAPFGLAAWNPRAEPAPGDTVLTTPLDVLSFAGIA